MFNRVVTCLMILGVLASQLARIPHGHEGMSESEKDEHDRVPHLHLASPVPHGGHSHQTHSHTGDPHTAHPHLTASHWHNDLCAEQSEQNQKEAPSLEGLCPQHHALIIYLSGKQAADITPVNVESQAFNTALAPMLIVGLDAGSSITLQRHTWRPPDDDVLNSSGTYLILRQLRI
jgi:hypothetical protein